jgi:hypothetical protein
MWISTGRTCQGWPDRAALRSAKAIRLKFSDLFLLRAPRMDLQLQALG